MELLNPWTTIHDVAPWDNWWVTIIWFPATEKTRDMFCLQILQLLTVRLEQAGFYLVFTGNKLHWAASSSWTHFPLHGSTHSILLCKGLVPKCSTSRFSSIFCLDSITCYLSQLDPGLYFHFPHQIPALSSLTSHTPEFLSPSSVKSHL